MSCQYVMTEDSLLGTKKKRNPSRFSAVWLIDQQNKHPKGKQVFSVALYINFQPCLSVFWKGRADLVKYTLYG